MNHIQANGIQIEYAEHGEQFNEHIVLIRGLGTQLTDWPPSLVQGLVDASLHVVIFDNRDVGLSEKISSTNKPAYSIDDMATDVVGLMDALNIDKAHIFGISMGGMIAQLMAVNHASRVQSLLSVMSTSGKPGLPGPSKAALASLMAKPAVGRANILAASADGLEVCGSPGYPESLEMRLAIAADRYDRCYCPEGVARQYAAVMADGDRSDRLQSISVCTTVIHGVDDPLINVACGKDTAKCIPNSTFVPVTGMGHNLVDAMTPILLPIIADHRSRVGSLA